MSPAGESPYLWSGEPTIMSPVNPYGYPYAPAEPLWNPPYGGIGTGRPRTDAEITAIRESHERARQHQAEASIPRLPHTVRVGAYTFDIKRDPELLGRDRNGETRFYERVIGLLPLLNEEQSALTFLHELLHCVDTDRSVGLSEPQIANLEHGLFAVLTDLGFYPPRLKLASDP